MAFEALINRVLANEGGYVNNPADPGGETIWGISRRSFPNFNGGDFKNATREQAIDLYHSEFWVPTKCDQLHPIVQFQALDFAVNSGIHVAIMKMQRALGVADDGVWGAHTQSAADVLPDMAFAVLLLAERLDFMTTLSNWPNASRGWSRRIAADLRYAARDFEGIPA